MFASLDGGETLIRCCLCIILTSTGCIIITNSLCNLLTRNIVLGIVDLELYDICRGVIEVGAGQHVGIELASGLSFGSTGFLNHLSDVGLCLIRPFTFCDIKGTGGVKSYQCDVLGCRFLTLCPSEVGVSRVIESVTFLQVDLNPSQSVIEHEVALVELTGSLTIIISLCCPYQRTITELGFCPSIILVLISIATALTTFTDIVTIGKVLGSHRFWSLLASNRPTYLSVISRRSIPVRIGLCIYSSPFALTPRWKCGRCLTGNSESIDGQLRLTTKGVVPIALQT